MIITFYWMNENKEREYVEIHDYLDGSHSEAIISRVDGSFTTVPVKDLVVVTDICN